MKWSREELEGFVRNPPGEGLNREYTSWIDPETPEGKAKIVKTVLALRNQGGGALVIGLNDKTLKPAKENAPSSHDEVILRYPGDKIQRLILNYSSETFGVEVSYPKSENATSHPVIVVPEGIENPVTAKKGTKKDGGNRFIKEGDLYLRSFSANHTPSTITIESAIYKDILALMERCRANREGVKEEEDKKKTMKENLENLLEEGDSRFEKVKEEIKKKRSQNLPPHGTWEAALIIDGKMIDGEKREHENNEEFLDLLSACNPRYIDWPVWLDSRYLIPKSHLTRTYDDAWEATIVELERIYVFPQIEFMRLDPKGRFYLNRALQCDLKAFGNHPDKLPSLAFLDPTLHLIRVAEAIAVGIAFAKTMGYDPERTELAFAFRWKKLKNRQFISLDNNHRFTDPRYVASQDEKTTFATVPLETPLSALAPYVKKALAPLYRVFNGFSFDPSDYEKWTKNLVEKKGLAERKRFV